MSQSLQDLKDEVREGLIEHIRYNDCDVSDNYISDEFHEIVDGAIPVYTYDLMNLAGDNMELILESSELFGGGGTPLQNIQGNLYEILYSEISEFWSNEIEQIIDEYQDRLNDISDMPLDEMIEAYKEEGAVSLFEAFDFHSGWDNVCKSMRSVLGEWALDSCYDEMQNAL